MPSAASPIIRDLRISVELIVSLLAQGVTVEDILDDYPALAPDDAPDLESGAMITYPAEVLGPAFASSPPIPW